MPQNFSFYFFLAKFKRIEKGNHGKHFDFDPMIRPYNSSRLRVCLYMSNVCMYTQQNSVDSSLGRISLALLVIVSDCVYIPEFIFQHMYIPTDLDRTFFPAGVVTHPNIASQSACIGLRPVHIASLLFSFIQIFRNRHKADGLFLPCMYTNVDKATRGFTLLLSAHGVLAE